MIIHDTVVKPLIKIKWRGSLIFFVGVSKKRLPKRNTGSYTIAQEKLSSGKNLIVGWEKHYRYDVLPVIFREENAPEEGEVFTTLMGGGGKKKLTYRVPEEYTVEVNAVKGIKIGFLMQEEE